MTRTVLRPRGTFTILSAALVLTSQACKKDNAKAAAAAPTGMVVGPENITVVKAEEIRSGPAISGTLQPEEQATVRAEVSGAVLQTYAEQGQRVTSGQLLGRIDDSAIRDQVLSARSAVTTAKNNADVAARQQARSEALVKAGAIAERDVELTRNQLSAAEAQLANARAMLANAQKQLDKTSIHSPFSGIVSARQVSAGDVVSPGGALFTVVNPATMRLEASVPADQLSEVHVGAPVDFTVNGYPGRHFTGRVTRINPVADPSTRQVRIIVSLPNQNGVLVGGLFADGHVSSEVRTAPVVPLSAVDERGLHPFVMLIKGGQVKKADVDLGIRDASNETVEIRSGLAAGDSVLLGAARGISPGTPVRVGAIGADTTK
ncbi:MAG TPA: efflux RND transporter periplasmic adaptor subunit [Gemmatimonadaceae bacterium]